MNPHYRKADLKEAIFLIRHKRFKDADRVLDICCEEENRSASENLCLSHAYFLCADYSKALAVLPSEKDLTGDFFKYYFLSGRIHFQLKKNDAAKSAFELALTHRPEADVCNLFLGIMELEHGNFYAANAKFSSLTDDLLIRGKVAPLAAYAKIKCGSGAAFCANVEDPDEFLLDCLLSGGESFSDREKELLLSLYSHCFMNLTVLEAVLIAKNIYALISRQELQERCMSWIKKKQNDLDHNDLSSGLLCVVGKVFDKLELSEEAVQLYARVVDNGDISEIGHLEIGQVYFERNDFENALQAFAKVVEQNPNHDKVYFLLCQTYEESGEVENSLNCAKFHLNISPRDPNALGWLAEFYLQAEHIGLAEKQIVKLTAVDPEYPSLNELRERFRGVFGRLPNPNTTFADYHYIDWERITIPEEFQYRKGPNTERIFRKPLQIMSSMSNVVSALVIREMTSRFGRAGLGYLWVVIQQMAFIGLFAVILSVRGKSLPYGVEIFGFLITGVCAFFIFDKTKGQMAGALEKNRNILFYRQVSPFSIYLARALLEFGTGLVVFTLLIAASILLGETINMTNALEVIGVLCLLSLFGTCYGLMIGSISVYFPFFVQLESAAGRILFFTSGLFFYANELPTKLREVLMWNPLFNLIELLREGFFATYTSIHASYEYVSMWAIGLLFFSLVFERVSRSRALNG